jgi:hypothetical protein
MLTPASGNITFRGTDWPEDLVEHAEQLSRSPCDVNELPRTSIVASSREPLDSGVTQLWCAAFQLAWDELKGSLGGTVEAENPPLQVALLNRHPFDAEALSPSCRLSAFGSTADSARILKAAQDRFPDVEPVLHDTKGFPPGSLQIYAAIRKQMPFETEFLPFDEPLRFQGTAIAVDVKSFGHERSDRGYAQERVFVGQVEILDDRGDDDFIVRLATSGPQKDHIIVAMVPPADSLHATWLSIRERIANPNPEHHRFALEIRDILQVPVLDFQLSRRFEEIEGVLLENDGGLKPVVVACMNMQLRLDETGADLFAEAEVVYLFGGEEYDPNRPRRLIVNRPFLIAFTEPDASEPYFIGWIANEEVMELY